MSERIGYSFHILQVRQSMPKMRSWTVMCRDRHCVQHNVLERCYRFEDVRKDRVFFSYVAGLSAHVIVYGYNFFCFEFHACAILATCSLLRHRSFAGSSHKRDAAPSCQWIMSAVLVIPHCCRPLLNLDHCEVLTRCRRKSHGLYGCHRLWASA